MEWQEWIARYPARVVDEKPARPWYETTDEIDAHRVRDHMELTHGCACEVVRYGDHFYVEPKL